MNGHSPTASCALTGLAARLRTMPPSCGPVRLIAVDGHAGSGKSTLAGRLARALGGAPVLSLDDLASHDALFGWTGRLTGQVLEPLSRGAAARYAVYDWTRRAFTGEREVPAAPIVIVEGVGAGRRAVRPYLTAVLWMELPPEVSWARGRHRDGPGLAEFWDGWTRAEREHFAGDPTRPYADLLVRQSPEGYELLAGPVRHRPGSPSPDSR
ncbi:uridine kinase family protein [Streptomyces gobiensis]|uniref:uridine kinase family protein n=1 Tax=Streptomyces gobiensis TaxID=2875706 RepID=UPI001E57E9B3|nr:hypothetical protein [Streptomyces gobiensis]UGY90338.1 hypothetical protein test1122_00410 [Streptomyces gobiensis]